MSLAITTAILIALLGTVTFLHFSGADREVTIEVTPRLSEIRLAGDRYYLPVEIANRGDRAGADVRVEIALVDTQGGRETTEVFVDFLAGHQTRKGTAGFRSDPRLGTLRVDAVSYLEP